MRARPLDFVLSSFICDAQIHFPSEWYLGIWQIGSRTSRWEASRPICDWSWNNPLHLSCF